ncbi:hypothetical protein [Zongyangia hominis]|nr:hypothetical protein [Zongyangia hominis]
MAAVAPNINDPCGSILSMENVSAIIDSSSRVKNSRIMRLFS